jgi:hypothetical protein
VIVPKTEEQIIREAASCGEQILDELSARPVGRVSDVADLAFAYHLARALLMRDTQITDEEKLITVRIVDAVADRAGELAAEQLSACGRLKASDG